MIKRTLLIVAVAAATLAASQAQTLYTWTGATNASFGEATNWNPQVVPTSADRILVAGNSLIDVAAAYTLTPGSVNTQGAFILNGSSSVTTSTLFTGSGSLEIDHSLGSLLSFVIFADNVHAHSVNFAVPVTIKPSAAGAAILWKNTGDLTFSSLTISGSRSLIFGNGWRATTGSGKVIINTLIGGSGDTIMLDAARARNAVTVQINDPSQFEGNIRVHLGGKLYLGGQLGGTTSEFKLEDDNTAVYLLPGVSMDKKVVCGFRSRAIIGIEAAGTASWTGDYDFGDTSYLHFAAMNAASTFTVGGRIINSTSLNFAGNGTVLLNTTTGSGSATSVHIGRLVQINVPNTGEETTYYPTTLGGAVTITAPATIYGGAGLTNASGELRFNGGLNMSQLAATGTGNFKFLLTASPDPVSASTINLGSIILSGDYFSFSFAGGFTPADLQTFGLFFTTGGITGTVDTSRFTIDSAWDGALSTNGNNLTLTVFSTIPEPTTWALLGVTGLIVVALRRRK